MERRDPSITDAIAGYLAHCKTENNIQDSTHTSYSKTLQHFAEYLRDQAVERIGDVEITHIRFFLSERQAAREEAGLTYTPRTRRKELEHIRFLINYSIENEWIAKNPAKKVKVKVPKGGGTKPLTDEEINTLLAACRKITNHNKRWIERARLRSEALILGMCYTGFRISDMMTLKRSEVRRNGDVNNHIMVKTQELVFTTFGEQALRALLALPLEGGEYFFWNGVSKLSTATGSCRRTLYSLQRMTGISVHPRRFRATFARKVLDETGDIRVLQHLLGHMSVRTTEDAYSYLGKKHEVRLKDALAKVSYGDHSDPMIN